MDWPSKILSREGLGTVLHRVQALELCLLRVWSMEAGLVVEECRPGKTRDPQQNRKREVSLECDAGLDLHRWF